MVIYINKPEFALKRAEEFLDVGKRVRALEALTEAIKNRKPRIWQKSHEDIMKKFIQLCVELKQSQTAKEGLHQYKNLTASVNPKSLEDLIRYYLKLSEAKCNEAREKANIQAAAPIADVDDLDLAESPEGMLLKVVSTDTSQDRADRVVLLPWVRFHWEAYRHCLDLLRNLSKLEPLYHDIASQAFKFCALYVRKTELRKLCEMLRNHIGQISKREVITANAVNLNNPETQELNLRTRLVQLDHAISMEMWQEAFRAIEDVHGLMSMLKKVPKAALKANYFEKLALVFLRAGNAVFHAAAQHQLFTLYRNFRKDLNPEELRKLAVAVLFATLAVPLQPPRTHLESLLEYDDTAATKMKQLTLLVGYGQPPTRAKLIEDLQKLGILQYIRPELQSLYHNLEVAFDPLHMGSRVAEVLAFVNSNEDLASVRHYVSVIEEVAVGKQLRQLSQVYDCLEIQRVIQLMPYTNGHTIERVAIETARNTDLEVRIDHRRPGLFVFGSDVALAPYEAAQASATEASSETQPTDRVRSQLVMLLTSLTRTSRVIKSQAELNVETDVRQQLFALYRKSAYRDQMSNLQRPTKTDNRQKMLEEKEKAKEHQAMMAKNSKEKESAAAENLRMQRDTRQFEEQRSRLKEKELEKQVIREKIEKMKQTEFGMRVLKELEDLENVDVKELDRLELRHREEMKREEEENNQRLKVQEKKIDHTIRARQLEELALRKEDNARMIDSFKDIWLQEENRRIALLHEEREFMMKKRDKMARIKPDQQSFMGLLQDQKRQVYADKMSAWQKLFEEQKSKRLEDRRNKREEDRRVTFETQQRFEEEQRQEEALRRQAEEEATAKRIADEERRRKFEEIEAKQRQREREVEEKRKHEDEDRFRTRPALNLAPRTVPLEVGGHSAPWQRGDPLTAPTVMPASGGVRVAAGASDQRVNRESGAGRDAEFRRNERPQSPPRHSDGPERSTAAHGVGQDDQAAKPGVYRPPINRPTTDQQSQQPLQQGPRIITLPGRGGPAGAAAGGGGGGGGGGGLGGYQDSRAGGGRPGGAGFGGPARGDVNISRAPLNGAPEPEATKNWRN